MIKFRAWDKVQNKMLLPDNIEFIHGQAYWAEASTDGQDECSNDGKVDGIGALFELEQFTGLKDVNGKDIYEGDIVRYTRWADHVGIVRYFKPEFELQNIGPNIDIAPTLTMRHELRIIGNVHENADLLEADK
ncbi:hypothetical protein FIV11_04005 [Lactiplantibacillus plantarum]|uniref:YopX family protein n=1 Tax=Lactiplantibacillus plantarum TaxID=1590 RepID=UPI002650239F|nr:YopX family protein [Lactiplantibacillus plantarum]MDN7060893.1 hypothetical protein [Lactiplantibacillus plantarum]